MGWYTRKNSLLRMASRSSIELGCLDQDHELVTTEAADRIGLPHHPVKAMRDLAKELVPGRVAECVVDVLELVEVDEQGGHAGVVAAGSSRHLLGAVENEGAVGEARQGVMARLVSELSGAFLDELEPFQPRLRHGPRQEVEQQRQGDATKEDCQSLVRVAGRP